ncbi:MAG: hypothetical protein H0V89_12090 [Deltaproteobacteria bacterium]|nr:hypothetical protein [Deltaproteobacteria bacterium]
MNIYLLPYSWARHVAVAWVVAGAAAIAWWLTLMFVLLLGPWFWQAGMMWKQGVEGALYLANVSGAIAFTSLYAEGALRRRAVTWRWFYALTAGFFAWSGTLTAFLFWSYVGPLFVSDPYIEVMVDPSLVTLRYRMMMWLFAGLASGAAAWFVRMIHKTLANRWSVGLDVGWIKRPVGMFAFLAELFYHLGGGAAGGLVGGALWHTFGFYSDLAGNLYLGAALGAVAWGLLHGLLCWGVPDDLYAGWIRVLSHDRYGVRIPLDSQSGTVERFVGHFPRGLDLYLPVERGVAELHASFLADEHQRYSVRGLSVSPTVTRRFLERIDLRYDPRRPAPFETELEMEDRVQLGEKSEASVEFLLLPREEA